MPRSVSSISSATPRAAPRRRRPSAWRDRPRRGWSRPHRPGRRRAARASIASTIAPQRRGIEVGVHEQEVERQMQLVLARAVERDQLLEVEHVRLADEDPRRRRLVGDRAPAPQDVVHLGAVRRVHLPHARARGRCGWSSGVAAGSSRSSRSLTIACATSIRKPAIAAVEPEAQDVVERARTSSFHQFRSGWLGRNLCR